MDWKKLDGTLQTDILKEYIAQKEWIFPPRPHLRLIGDLIGFCVTEVPKFHPLSVSGYHIREARSTAQQEVAFTLADGFSYVELVGGSYLVESLTNRMEEAAEEYFARIDDMGTGSMREGMLVGIERGYFQSEIADAAYREQGLYRKGRLTKVGVTESSTRTRAPSTFSTRRPRSARCRRSARCATGETRPGWRRACGR